MKKKSKENIWFFIMIFLLFLIDQLTKQATYNLANGVQGYSMKIFGNFFRITYIENHGGIFGVLQGHIMIFTVLSILLIAYIYATELKNFTNYSLINKLGTSFIIAGACGNMFDRLFRGYVIDMLDFRGIWSFIFNLADVYIHIGVYILIIAYIVKRRKEK